MATNTATAPATQEAVTIADPGPLGLSAFALTTFVLSSVNANLIPVGVESVVLGLAFFYGGIVQVVAGIWEFRKGNTFGATAFCSYGGFWLSFWGVVNWLKPGPLMTKTDVANAVGVFLLGWTIFTAIMLIASLRTNLALVVVFILLTITFILLTAGKFQASDTLTHAGGWFGLITAALAWYTGMAGVVNETWKRAVLPVWKI